jgi:tol-pal system protein YbgF
VTSALGVFTPWKRATLAAVLLVVFGGCASSMPETPGARRSAEIDALQARVTQLAQQAAVNESEIARLRQQVAALEARVGAAPRRDGVASNPPASPAGTPPPSRPAAAGAPAAAAPRTATAAPAPTPRPAAPAPRPAAPPTAAAPPIEESDLTVEEVEVVLPPPRPAAPAPSSPTAPPASAPAGAVAPGGPLTPVSREAQVVYDEAYTFYHQGRYDEAEARFQEFLAMSPATELSDNAQYWIGACRFAKRDFRGALAAFRRTVETYPGENKVPDALFKMGQALEELDEPTEALEVYGELVRRFPDTAAATLAAERQEKLR